MADQLPVVINGVTYSGMVIANPGSGGGGGGAATIANGADVAEGNTADTAYSDATGAAAGSMVALNKGEYVALRSLQATNGAIGDGAYAGTGNASQVAALKGLYALLAGTLTTASAALTATTDYSGTATTTSGGLTVGANPSRKFLVGQNISAVSIGFNEQGGTAAIGTAGTYTVAAGASFSISTNKAVNFIAASGTAAVTMTGG